MPHHCAAIEYANQRSYLGIDLPILRCPVEGAFAILLGGKIDLAPEAGGDVVSRIGQLEPDPERAAARVEDGVDDLHGGAIFAADGGGGTDGGDHPDPNLGEKSDRQIDFDVQ